MRSIRRAVFLAVGVCAAVTIAACTSSATTHTPRQTPSSAGLTAHRVTTASKAHASSRGSSHSAPRTPKPSGTGYTPSLAQAPNDHPKYYHSYCQVTQSMSTTHLCTFGDTTHPATTVAMVGDSVTAQWIAGMVTIAKSRHWKIVTDFHSRCPWTATMTVNSGTTVPYTTCYAWGRNAMSDILTRIKPDVVVTSDRPVLRTVHHQRGPASLAEIGAGMATYWRTLLRHHIDVVPIHESPEMGFDVPTCLKQHSVSACTVPASRAITPDPPTVVATRAMNGRVHMVNLNGVICPHRTCRPVVGHIVKFQDKHHLTSTYALSIVAQLRARLLATGAFS